MSNVTIKLAQVTDASILASMLAQLAKDIGDGDVFCSDSKTIESYGFGSEPMFQILISRLAQKPVGFALFFKHFSTTKGKPGVYVQDLWVDAAVRGTGTGQNLLGAVADHTATTWGAAFIKLAVHLTSPRAKQFYTRLGFAESSTETAMILAEPHFTALRKIP